MKPLYVVTAISNPCRYKSRYRLYRDFAKHVADSGANLCTVELALGERPFEVTGEGPREHWNQEIVQLRTKHELWHKENLLNIGISRLPADAEYIAVIDADLTFIRPGWAEETVQQLQHYPVVQMFSEVCYLGPDEEFLNKRIGFAERWQRGYPFSTAAGRVKNQIFYHPKQNAADAKYDEWGPPGGAWAYRREALDAAGGLIDFCVLGSADWYMAAGKAGFMQQAMQRAYHPELQQWLLDWQRRADRAFRRNIGVVPGSVFHHWHGKMQNRRYGEREQILKGHAFNPRTDLKRDTQGLWQLHDDGSTRYCRLRDAIMAYFRGRNEDGIDL